jgi:hypothetical protein
MRDAMYPDVGRGQLTGSGIAVEVCRSKPA